MYGFSLFNRGFNHDLNSGIQSLECIDNRLSVLELQTIAIVTSPYGEKFAIPRQPGLVPAARGQIKMQGAFNNPDCLAGLEAFSHIWLQFIFHQTAAQGWKPKVRPPRLGGNAKIGVFASRSTFRPNPIGLSVVRLHGIHSERSATGTQWFLEVSGLDLLDGTPIVDIKPYIAYSDAIVDAQSGYAAQAPTMMPVRFSANAEAQLVSMTNAAELQTLITQVLAQDPRPAVQQCSSSARVYGVRLAGLNVQWQVEDNTAIVTAVEHC